MTAISKLPTPKTSTSGMRRTWNSPTLTDDKLVRFGKAARFMCRDKSPRQVFVIQFESAEQALECGTRL